MKNLNALFNQCMEEVKAAGIEPGRIVKVEINRRATRRWGQCVKEYGVYKLNFAERILMDDTDEKGVKETIIHEILHTCKGCMNHGKEWNRLGGIMERRYGYKITRTASYQNFGIDPEIYRAEKVAKAKYQIICKKCGHASYRNRASNVTKYPALYNCKCGGQLVVNVL